MMNPTFWRKLLIVAIGFLGFLSVQSPDGGAATTFIGSTIERIDPGQQMITFKTREGQSWTLEVADSSLLKKPLAKGDQVSIEIGTNDKITKIIKLAEAGPGGGSPEPPEAGQPRE